MAQRPTALALQASLTVGSNPTSSTKHKNGTAIGCKITNQKQGEKMIKAIITPSESGSPPTTREESKKLKVTMTTPVLCPVPEPVTGSMPESEARCMALETKVARLEEILASHSDRLDDIDDTLEELDETLDDIQDTVEHIREDAEEALSKCEDIELELETPEEESNLTATLTPKGQIKASIKPSKAIGVTVKKESSQITANIRKEGEVTVVPAKIQECQRDSAGNITW